MCEAKLWRDFEAYRIKKIYKAMIWLLLLSPGGVSASNWFYSETVP